MTELHILLIFMIIGAIYAIEAKDLFSSIVALGAVGLGLCMAFIILKAPDVAITQLVVETLALIILLRATLKTDIPFSTSGRWVLNTTITAVFIIVFLVIAAKCLKDLPEFGYPTMRVASTYLKEGLTKTGATNMVSAIVLDYRALDTLCESTILITAVIGVLSIIRRIGKRKTSQPISEDDE